MNVTEHFNVNNVNKAELDLPTLPAGCSWKISERRYDSSGVWLILELYKMTSYSPLINIFRDFWAMNTARPVLVSSRRVVYYRYIDDSSKHPNAKQVKEAFAQFAATAYLEAFPELEKAETTPQPHSIYVGTYNEKIH